MRKGLGNNLARKCLAGMLWFLDLANSVSKFVLVYIHFLSLVELERWLAGVAFFPSSTPTTAFQCSRYTSEQGFSSLPGHEVSGGSTCSNDCFATHFTFMHVAVSRPRPDFCHLQYASNRKPGNEAPFQHWQRML